MISYLIAMILQLYIVVLLIRLVLSWVTSIQQDWRPTGFVLVLANLVYTLTDPPLKWIGRWLRPVRLGAMSWDLAPLVLIVLVTVGIRMTIFIPW